MRRKARNREELKLELAQQVLSSSGELRFVARGASMIPSIFPGDMLIVRHEPITAARCGNVVLWARDGNFCAHRVVKIAKGGQKGEIQSVTTRGDALGEDDLTIHSDEFLGRVHTVVRRGKRIELANDQSGSRRGLAFVARRSDFAVRWLLRCNALMWRLSRSQRLFPSEPWRRSIEAE